MGSIDDLIIQPHPNLLVGDGLAASEILSRLQFLEEVLEVPNFVGVPFLATKLGVSPPYLRAHPYMLPAYGISAVPGKSLWPLDEVRAWLKVTPEARRQEWERLPPSTRRAIVQKRARR